jgi:hypothetical protein
MARRTGATRPDEIDVTPKPDDEVHEPGPRDGGTGQT